MAAQGGGIPQGVFGLQDVFVTSLLLGCALGTAATNCAGSELSEALGAAVAA